MTDLITAVHPVLKNAHFQKRGRAFNRVVAPDRIIHVVSFQMGAFNPPGTVEIPGLRRNLYGLFTINLGAWLPGVPETGYQQLPESPRKFVNDYNCHIRARIGELLPAQEDTWWHLDLNDQELPATVISALIGYGLPWLSGFTTWSGILAQLEAAPAYPTWFMSPPRLTAMKMRLARGERAEAEADFAAHLSSYRTKGRNPGHYQVLAEIAEANSFTIDMATESPAKDSADGRS
jgi:hypothetical protein